MGRALRDEFFNRFKSKDLNPIIKLIDKNGIYRSRFMFQLRGDKVIIYYKCLKALTIYDNKRGSLTRFEYTPAYAEDIIRDEEGKIKQVLLKEEMKQLLSCADKKKKGSFYLTPEQIVKFNWKKYLSLISDGIDEYSVDHQDKAEKEAQQRIWYENNIARGSKDTKYVIIDTEYQDGINKGQYDLVALYWSNQEKNPEKIAMIELKFTESACGGSKKAKKENQIATLQTHFEDFVAFKFTEDFYKDITKMFFQLHALGMINTKTIGENVDKKMFINDDTQKQMVFMLANYNPDSSLLGEQIDLMKTELPKNKEIVFARSSCCGYGLYGSCMIDKDKIVENLKN